MKKANLFALSLLGLFLAVPALAAPPTMPADVVAVIKSEKQLSKFAELLQQSDLASVLAAKGEQFTVFAPNNDAMAKIPADVFKRAKEENDGLKTLAGYHVIKGSVVFAGNIKGRRASPSSMVGGMIGFDGTGKTLNVNNGVIVKEDMKALNGVVHIVNAAFVPELLEDPKIKEEARIKAEKEMQAEMEARQKEMEAEEAKRAAAAAKEAPKAAEKPAAEQPAAPVEAPEAAPIAEAPAAAPVEATQVPATQKEQPKKEKAKSGWKSLFGL